AIGACNDGPTDVNSEAALSAADGSVAAKHGPSGEHGKKKEQYDICHYDATLNDGAGALVHLNVNGNAWDGGGDGCGGKVNGHGKQTGHNGHELDVNWNPDTNFVATECEAFCYEDQDGDGLTDDVDPCIFDADNDSDADGVCLSDGDTCYADPGDSDGGTDADGDGICEEGGDAVDNCPDVANTDQTNSDGDTLGDACDNCPAVDNEDQADDDSDGIGTACEADTDADGIPDDAYGTVCVDGQTNGNTACDDNCVDDPNTAQWDGDADGIGNACDDCHDVDSDGYGSDQYVTPTCNGGQVDCRDDLPAVNPGAIEDLSTDDTCTDGLDNDCDGLTDYDDSPACYD
ncbi:MAG: hypothetical protein WBW88_05845, partial [Rhodothermales bacterium]